MKDYQVYMIACRDGSYYTGISKDIIVRFKKHATGYGAKYFRRTKPDHIAWNSNWMSKSDALKLEIKIKKLSHTEKKVFITAMRSK